MSVTRCENGIWTLKMAEVSRWSMISCGNIKKQFINFNLPLQHGHVDLYMWMVSIIWPWEYSGKLDKTLGL